MSQATGHNRTERFIALLLGWTLILALLGLPGAGAEPEAGRATHTTPCGDLTSSGSQYLFQSRLYDNVIVSNDANIAGTPGNDFICGGSADNAINGFGGNDALFGRAGDDTIDGGNGHDLLSGGFGDDALNGWAGADELHGDQNDDELNGGGQADTLDGGAGNDTLLGGGGQDALEGGGGDDHAAGGPQADVANGGPGDDTLNGNGGDDTLNGNDGNDTIKGQNGTDTATGMAGTDLCIAETEISCENFAPVPKDPGNDAHLWLTEQNPGGKAVGAIAKSVDGDSLSIIGVDDSATTADVTFTAAEFSVDPRTSHDNLPNYPTVASEQIVVMVSDGTDTTGVNVTLDIHGFDDDPDADDDSIDTLEATPVSDNLLTNDSDPDDGDSLTLVNVGESSPDTAVTGPTTFAFSSGGSVDIDTDGSVTYTPPAITLASGETHVDTLEYGVSDNAGHTDTATATFTVTGTDDRPVANDDDYTTDEDTAITGDLLSNDVDDDGEPISIGSVNGLLLASPYTLASGAILDLNADGTFTYTPSAAANALAVGEELVDTLVYRITDGEGDFSDEATVTFTIEGTNDSPTAVFDTTGTTEDGTVTIDPAANDTDPDTSDTLGVSAVDTATTNGDVTINLDGTVTYDTDGEFEWLDDGGSDLDYYGYTVSDGNGGTDTNTVAVLITGVNDAPVAVDDDVQTDEDTAVAFNLLGDNGNGSDYDVDTGDTPALATVNGQPITGFTVILLPSGSTLEVDTDASANYIPAPGMQSLATGHVANDSFVYTTTDGDAASAAATVSVSIDGVNDDPDAVDDPDEETDEDTA
ncbi:MAG: Ig-like domain-containing protein, partial [Acidimicrobiales bacterium]